MRSRVPELTASVRANAASKAACCSGVSCTTEGTCLALSLSISASATARLARRCLQPSSRVSSRSLSSPSSSSACSRRLCQWATSFSQLAVSGLSRSKLEFRTEYCEAAFSASASALLRPASASSKVCRLALTSASASASSRLVPSRASRCLSASHSAQKSRHKTPSTARPLLRARNSWYRSSSARCLSRSTTAPSISLLCWKCIRVRSCTSSSSFESLAYSSLSCSEPLMVSSTPVSSVPCLLAISMTSP
mmetsp:Transcript_11637/g.34008  ORF Transcript_11637/g.34008 Transcript_11637/m.34008 type:complete len:251 (-) Transcript_11637:38-790(-)